MVAGSRVMMWCNYWVHDGNSLNSVPSPYEGDASIPTWYSRIIDLIPTFAAQGFTDLLIPNPIEQSSIYSAGYSPFNDYSVWPSRFGTKEELLRLVSLAHAFGMKVIIDHVMHQRSGGRAGTYRYKSATGKTNGRFPKDPGCFRAGEVRHDPVPSPIDDYAFGDQLSPVTGVPKGYVWDELVAAAAWLFSTFGFDGARLDDTKGEAIEFVKAFMNSRAMAPKWFFGEYASGSRNDTDWWVNQVDGRSSSLDFDDHYNALMPMTSNGPQAQGFWMSSLAGRGMFAVMPSKAVRFAESMDSDVNGFATIVVNKCLAYAYMMGGEGLPMAYIRDYLKEPNCYGLKERIGNFAWINRMKANGGTIPRWGDEHVFVYERTGAPGLVVALNNDWFNPSWRTVTIQTNHANTQWHDYSGNNEMNAWSNHNGQLTFGIPPGANGMGYGMWSPINGDGAISITPTTTKQTFFGAEDLDLGPALNGTSDLPERVYCKAGTPISMVLTVDRVGWSASTEASVCVYGSSNKCVASATADAAGASSISGKAAETGWHRIEFACDSLPVTGSGFELGITYTGAR